MKSLNKWNCCLWGSCRFFAPAPIFMVMMLLKNIALTLQEKTRRVLEEFQWNEHFLPTSLPPLSWMAYLLESSKCTISPLKSFFVSFVRPPLLRPCCFQHSHPNLDSDKSNLENISHQYVTLLHQNSYSLQPFQESTFYSYKHQTCERLLQSFN